MSVEVEAARATGEDAICEIIRCCAASRLAIRDVAALSSAAKLSLSNRESCSVEPASVGD